MNIFKKTQNNQNEQDCIQIVCIEINAEDLSKIPYRSPQSTDTMFKLEKIFVMPFAYP